MGDRPTPALSAIRAWLMRVWGLLHKEVLQIRRDPSSIALALVMPVVLLILFGYGVTFDAENIEVAAVLDDQGAAARTLYAQIRGSRYFIAERVDRLADAEELLARRRVAAFFHVQSDFEQRLTSSGSAPVQVVVDGVDANRARLIAGYALGIVQAFNAARARDAGVEARSGQAAVTLDQRIWFNEDLSSQRTLVPGLIALIMTLTGLLLTALVLVREKERGTLEALLVTPVRGGEIMLAKLLPYFLLGLTGLAVTVVLGRLLFRIPLQGSPPVLLLIASLFMLASLGIGLLISALAPGQMVASQVSLLLGFLPSFFLSGLLFDLQSQPALARWLSVFIPTTYFIDAAGTIFLAGDFWPVLWKDAAVLGLMALVFLFIARLNVKKTLQ